MNLLIFLQFCHLSKPLAQFIIRRANNTIAREMGSSSAFLIQLHGLLRLGAPPSCQRIWALPGCLGIKYPKTTALLTALPLYRTYAAKKYRTRREKAIIFSRFKQQNPPVHSSIRPTGAFTTCFSPRYSRGLLPILRIFPCPGWWLRPLGR